MTEQVEHTESDRQTTPVRSRWYRPIHSAMQWLGRHETVVLVALILIAGGIWIFLGLADAVTEGATTKMDERILLLMRNPADQADPIGPPWVQEMGRDFTALGGTGILVLITLMVSGYLVLMRKFHVLVLLLVALGGAWVASLLLKSGFNRPRPDLVPHGAVVYNASFPSGHAMLSAAFYLTLGALVARLHPRPRVKGYVLAMALLITLIVGVSRVYLGVHWPSDVLAGWTLGAVWALICWLVARWLQRRGQVEQTMDDGL